MISAFLLANSHQIAIFLSAIVGTFSHWVHQKYMGKVSGNPFEYLKTYPWNTFAMFSSTIFAVATLLQTLPLMTFPISTVLMIGFTTGWTADSMFNKGPTKVKPDQSEDNK